MKPQVPKDYRAVARLIKQGEGAQLEFKRSTGELREGLRTLCAFLNGSGGMVLFGVRPDGVAEGQEVSDKTVRDIAQALDRFEPPVSVPIRCVALPNGREVIVLPVKELSDSIPYTYEGRPYERVGSTTRKMGQNRYEELLLQRTHSRRRWENQPAEEIRLGDVDREEVFRVLDAARSAGRLVGPVGRSLPGTLDRLGVCRHGRLLRAAVVLFGKTFLPDFPQCELRMARFRGTDKTEFLDQRQMRASAFKLLEEAMIFCQRHLPLPGRIEPGRLERADRPLIPPDALREILVNALIHRDYASAGGAVSLAIFDDRVEVWSTGRLPAGITPESLTREHPSILRNPVIADVFYRSGLIEKWGRGTNRVIEMCREAGIAAPVFREVDAAAVVTFRVPVAAATAAREQVGEEVSEQVGEQVGAQVARVLGFCRTARSRAEILAHLGLAQAFLSYRRHILPAVRSGLLELTIPDKPNSRFQKYRTTAKGLEVLARQAGA